MWASQLLLSKSSLLEALQQQVEKQAAMADLMRRMKPADAAAAAAAAAAAQQRRFAAGCDELRQAQSGARAREVAAQQLVQVRACGRAARALIKHLQRPTMSLTSCQRKCSCGHPGLYFACCVCWLPTQACRCGGHTGKHPPMAQSACSSFDLHTS